MSETTPLIKAALNLRVGVGFDVYLRALRVGRIFAIMYNEQGEVGKLYEEIIRYKICT